MLEFSIQFQITLISILPPNNSQADNQFHNKIDVFYKIKDHIYSIFIFLPFFSFQYVTNEVLSAVTLK